MQIVKEKDGKNRETRSSTNLDVSELEKFQKLQCSPSLQKVGKNILRPRFLFKIDILDFEWRTEVVQSSTEGLRSQES